MSDSRLEKFIYAICSMDVTDLPVPLSRIEKLWNCLITGETPDFEPLSRNEKYLMAMLDRYDISNLPAPMSRGEKLLYKIAVGETDLSDVPGYLSRYEELLKYLIENGGIGFEYVLYTLNQSLSTLYQTVEKPVKSAILKGQTLVNICKKSGKDLIYTNKNSSTDLCYKIKDNTWYYLIINVKQNTLNKPFKFSGWTLAYGATPMSGSEIGASDKVVFDVGETGVKRFKIGYSNIPEDRGKTLIMYASDSSTLTGQATYDIMLLEYQDGMENWDITYFEGMQSVKMPVLTTTGKNLYPFADIDIQPNSLNMWYMSNGVPQSRWGNALTHDCGIGEWFYIDEGYYSISCKTTYNFNFHVLAEGEKIVASNGENNRLFSSGWYTIRVKSSPDTLTNISFSNIQIEKGTVKTTYEPYKTNILTVNEDVTLRGIGDVHDTLDCMTGKVSSNFIEITLQGLTDEQYYIDSVSTNTVKILCLNSLLTPSTNQGSSSNGVCDKLPYKFMWGEDVEGWFLSSNAQPQFVIRLNKNKLETIDINGIKKYFLENPHTFVIKKDKSIKTVDLTTVDQDGQPTKLKTFNDVTYIEINSDSIIPSVDVEVATKINETLSTMGLQHHDISNTQNELGQTIDEQAENTDATMMATTEIYEQTL